MKNVFLAPFVVPVLTVPAFAGALSGGDKPPIVEEDVEVEVGNVVGVGERHRHRDQGHLYMSTPHRLHHDDRRWYRDPTDPSK